MVRLAHATSVLYIDERVLPVELESDPNDLSVRYSKLRLAFKTWQDPQLLHTSDGWSKHLTSKEPQRLKRFLALRLARLSAYWIVRTQVSSYIFPRPFEPLRFDDFYSRRRNYFDRVFNEDPNLPIAQRETLFRVALTIYWIWTAHATLECANITLSLLFVSVGLNSSLEWPRIFGSPLEAYSIRRF